MTMSEPMTASNVFYLPAPATAIERRRAPSRRAALRAALARTWRRLSVSVADIRAVFTEPCWTTAAVGFAPLPEATGDGGSRRYRQDSRRGPARVIDFAEARVRLRPTSGA